MKTLLILRHAKSSWDNARLADHDRPLNARGEADAPVMGALVREQEIIPQLIISSSAKRARATAEIVAEVCGEVEVWLTRDLYMAGPEEAMAILEKVSDGINTVMIVGHNPGMEELLTELTGLWERMPTAALAMIGLPVDSWQEVASSEESTLLNLWLPRELH